MLRILLAVFSVSAAFSPVYGQPNYCLAKFCGTPNTHIACGHDGSWGAACPTSPAPTLVELDIPLRQHVVTLHNTRRNDLAMGNIPNYQPVSRMATTRWSPELADFAARNVLQCIENYDECHNTNKFLNSGENLELLTYVGPAASRTTKDLLTEAINLWWMEHENANQAAMDSYPAVWTGGRIDRFALMANRYNWAVGCAVSTFIKNSENNFLLNCFYATKNKAGEPVYVSGTIASGCSTGTNINYDGLCKVDEIYDL